MRSYILLCFNLVVLCINHFFPFSDLLTQPSPKQHKARSFNKLAKAEQNKLRQEAKEEINSKLKALPPPVPKFSAAKLSMTSLYFLYQEILLDCYLLFLVGNLDRFVESCSETGSWAWCTSGEHCDSSSSGQSTFTRGII
jgi:hypothetical protein